MTQGLLQQKWLVRAVLNELQVESRKETLCKPSDAVRSVGGTGISLNPIWNSNCVCWQQELHHGIMSPKLSWVWAKKCNRVLMKHILFLTSNALHSNNWMTDGHCKSQLQVHARLRKYVTVSCLQNCHEIEFWWSTSCFWLQTHCIQTTEW